ncbi:hypothetical protein FE839_13885 [Klebsiella indica]|uniref:Uncharacterized protein n=1 Tax=Klebsiella indica TaxID=2582917 RepID=A0A5R9LGY6_9ENTR|nr:hypothetical protein FE839_13885 [Klebsiella indica]
MTDKPQRQNAKKQIKYRGFDRDDKIAPQEHTHGCIALI